MKKETLEGLINSKVLYLKNANGLSNEMVIAQKHKIFTMLNKANALYIALNAINVDYSDMTSRVLIEPIFEDNEWYFAAYLFTSYEKSMQFVLERKLISSIGPTIARLERYPSNHEYIFLMLLNLGIKRFVINACDKYEITLTIGEMFYKNKSSKRKPYDDKLNIDYSSSIKKICQLSLEEIKVRDNIMKQIETNNYQRKEKERDRIVDEIRIGNSNKDKDNL